MGNVDKLCEVFPKTPCGKENHPMNFIFWGILEIRNMQLEILRFSEERKGTQMKTELIFGRRVMNLPGDCLPYLSEASADALRVLLALGAENGADDEALSRMTGLSAERIGEALSFWQKAGVLEVIGERALPLPAEKDFSRPSYTGEDMARIAEDGDIRELIDVCSAILGKTFTPTETESLFYLRDGLRLDFEYVVRLCKYCYDIGKPSLRYIEKVGIDLYDRGIIGVPALVAYIENEEKKQDMEYRIRGLFGIGERALTPKEKEYLAAWTVDWNLPYDMIELAYQQMITAIGQPKFSYENGILKKWVEAGCRTKADAEALAQTQKPAKPKPKTEQKEIGFDLDEFFKAATMRGDGSAENG